MNDVGRPGRASLAGRLLTTYAVVFFVLIGLFGFLAWSGMVEVLRDQARDSLESEARVLAVDLRGRPVDSLQAAVDERAEALEARITVIALDGTVLADSAFDASLMENHGSRPEVLEALAGRVGVARRVSDTTGELQTYVATPALEDRIVRISVTEHQLEALTAAVGSRIGLAALVAGVAGVALVAVVARRIARPIEELTDVASRVSQGELDLRALPSSVQELHRLGRAVDRMSLELGNRILAAQAEADTLHALLDALPQGVVLFAPDEQVLYGNRTAETLIGPIPERVAKLAPHVLQSLIRDAARDEAIAETEIELGTPGPTIRAMAAPLPEDRVLLVLTDVSELIRIENMRRDFVADASHELKTPVSTILAAAETMHMAMERDPVQARRFLTSVEESARHLARLVGDLLDLSRLETSEPSDDPVELSDVVADEVERLRPQAVQAGVSLESDLSPVTVTGSSSDIALAVRNLIGNAIRYSESGDRVHVGMSIEGDAVRISVADTGAGIPRRSLGRVFERFFRVDVARSRQTGGTGLGLAIVKHVAESHGGAVSVESELGAGSTFHLVLPVTAQRRVTTE